MTKISIQFTNYHKNKFRLVCLLSVTDVQTVQTEDAVNRLRLVQTVARILSSGNDASQLMSTHKTLWLGFVARCGKYLINTCDICIL